MKQGTVSVICGVHSPIHAFLVLTSWRILYGKWPKFWQMVCIFLHDVGHLGLDYLDNYREKQSHWILGASLAYKLFGQKGYDLVAFHTDDGSRHLSFCPLPRRGLLYKPDKYSWYIAPRWWLYWNTLVESKLRMGYTRREAVRRFREQVRKSIESGEFRSTHQMYLQRCQENDAAKS